MGNTLVLLWIFWSIPSSARELGHWVIHEICIQEHKILKQQLGARWKTFPGRRDLEVQQQWAQQQNTILSFQPPQVKIVEPNWFAGIEENFYKTQVIYPLTLTAFKQLQNRDQFILEESQLVQQLKQQQYRAVLSTLLKWIEEENGWTFYYKKVQRMYSVQSRGDGKVAIGI